MFIFSNLATSLDGKIATASRERFLLGTPADRKQMQVLRKRADAVLMGASTLRTHQKFCGVQDATRQPANVILSSALEGISPHWPFFLDPQGQTKKRRILFVTRPLSASRQKAFEKTSELIRLASPSKGEAIAIQILKHLEERGVRRLLVEGGGGVMWDFASLNLIDEYHVTLTPWVLGGEDAPTLVDGAGFSPPDALKLKLVRCRKLKDELYLTYRRAQR